MNQHCYEIAESLLNKGPLLLTVEVNTVEEADELMRWMYAPTKPMKAKLIQIQWNQATVSMKVKEAIRVIETELAEAKARIAELEQAVGVFTSPEAEQMRAIYQRAWTERHKWNQWAVQLAAVVGVSCEDLEGESVGEQYDALRTRVLEHLRDGARIAEIEGEHGGHHTLQPLDDHNRQRLINQPRYPRPSGIAFPSKELGASPHPLVSLLMNYENCPDDAVDAAAALVGKLIEVHKAAGADWEVWMQTRSVDWFDEVAELLRPFE